MRYLMWMILIILSFPVYSQEPDFIKVPIVSMRIKDSSIYADIINHTRNPFLSEARTTNGHESTHDINNDLSGTTKWTKDGFYLLYGRGIILDRPRLTRPQINPFIPGSLRSSRYDLYFATQKYGGDSPLYVLDEYIAYQNGAEVAIDDLKNGRWREDRIDSVSGPLEFFCYSMSLCMAIEKHDHDYWRNNTKFKNFILWSAKRSERIFFEGIKFKENKFKEQDIILHNLRVAEDSKLMRDFINKHFEGVFLK
jgi:hypothetical protein